MFTTLSKQSSAEYQETKPYGYYSDVPLHLAYFAIVVSYLGTLALTGLGVMS